jgi:hypothetical protein
MLGHMECIKEFISFSDGWSKVADEELKSVITDELDEVGCFGTSSDDQFIELPVGHRTRGFGSCKEDIVALLVHHYLI